MKHTSKTCLDCNIPLNGNQNDINCNWSPSRIKRFEYRCKSCHYDRAVVIKNKNKFKKLEKLAKKYTTKHKKEYDKIKQGFIYIITNPAWKGWLKIGMAMHAKDRLNNYQTSSPFRDYELRYSKFFNNRRFIENKIHVKCEQLCKEKQGEWFKLNVQKAINVIKNIKEEQYEKETA